MTSTKARKSSERPGHFQLQELARLVGGELVGDPHTAITGVAGIREARPGDITFLAHPRYVAFLEKTAASAVILSPETVSGRKNVIRTPNPSLAFAKVLDAFKPAPDMTVKPGTHRTAVVDRSAKLGRRVSIGPCAIIEKSVHIGDGCVLGAGVFVGEGSRLGVNVRVHPNVVLRERTEIGDRAVIHSGTVIGADGFGYETVEGKHLKIPQTGFVCIEQDVEIGANVCVDRGRFGKTWIQQGTKIDNLVQIAHNVVIGPHCLIVSQAGVSGSSTLGSHVVLAGQAGVVGHVQLGDNVVVGAQAGITKSVPANTVMLGSPAKPLEQQKKLFALIARLPELFKDVQELKKKPQ